MQSKPVLWYSYTSLCAPQNNTCRPTQELTHKAEGIYSHPLAPIELIIVTYYIQLQMCDVTRRHFSVY